MKNIAPILIAAALAACSQPESESAAPPPSSETASAKATPNKPADIIQLGRTKFSQCAVCHSVKEGEASRVGPNLYGVVDRPAASLSDFAYSKAMRESGIAWTAENLDAFLENPQTFIRGNRMAYAGERSADNRAAIIAYLNSVNSKE